MLVRRVSRRSVSIAVVFAMGLALFGVAGPAHADPACDEDQFSIEDGPTKILAHGSTHFANADSSGGDQGGGQLTWSLKGQITGANTDSTDGSISGFMNYTIDWDDAKPTTTFASQCVLVVFTQVGHLLYGAYAGTMQNNPSPCTRTSGVQCVRDRPQGSLTQFVNTAIELDRVSPRRADLRMAVWSDETCFPQGPGFFIERNNAQALGDKTGNGGRGIDGCGI